MKSLHKFVYKTSIFFAILLVACNNDDQELLFDAPPTSRIEAREQELLNLIQSQQGFKVVYFTNNDTFGGFTFYMNFSDDGTVSMTSDFDTDTELVTSEYQVGTHTTTELTFSTRNHIHKLSDSSSPAQLRGTGFAGNSTFQYISNDPNTGNITFFDLRNEATLIFEPITQEEWANAKSLVEESFATRQDILTNTDISVFRNLTFSNNGEELQVFQLNFDLVRVFANPLGQSDTGEVFEFEPFGVAGTPNGLKISPPIEFEGNSFEDFVFDEASNTYTSTQGEITATIGQSATPAFITNDILQIREFDNGEPFFLFRPSLGTNPLTSTPHDTIIDDITTGVQGLLSGLGFSDIAFLDYVLNLDFNDSSTACESTLSVRFIVDGALFSFSYCFSLATIDSENRLFFEYTGPLGFAGELLESIAMPLIEFFGSESGMVATLEGSFVSSENEFSNQAATFTSLDNPSIRVYGLFF